MKKKIIATLFIVLSLVAALSACSAVTSGTSVLTGEIKQGVWSEDGKTFINEWSNIKFTMPEGFVPATEEQIEDMMKAGMETTGISDLAMMRVVYDFVASSPTGMPNITLAYESLKLNPALSTITEETYLDLLNEQFGEIEVQGFKYTEIERAKVRIADVDWSGASFSLNGIMYQDFYLHLQDGYMWQIIVTYDDTTAESVTDMLAGMTATK